MFGGSALTDDIEVRKGRTEKELNEDVPSSHVPARNTIFPSFAIAYAEVVGARDIFTAIGDQGTVLAARLRRR
ncbi:7-cyano-7-deazaguanine synthase [Amycolatopsis sp. cg5]|uniref:7-cyano-7-deazaguanine synthase n=1 Tax=Amycolatopsis sp. cg5 TaxID=3238802 RepID=UPI003526113C